MFKKSIAALAVLGAFAAGSAVAADVTIYGRADLGLRFTHVDSDMSGYDDVDTFEMATGNYTGNRVGIKGSEDLGNGMTVAFVLENGFDGGCHEFCVLRDNSRPRRALPTRQHAKQDPTQTYT